MAWKPWRVPVIAQAEGVVKSLLMQGEPIGFDGKCGKPRGCSFLRCQPKTP